MKLRFVMPVALILVQPLPVMAKQKATIEQPVEKELIASVGDVVARVTLKEPLPNAFGGSDIFGRKRERGFVAVRYMGLSPEGYAVFQRQMVDVVSNETTMSRSQFLGSGHSINQRGNGTSIAIINQGSDGTGMQVLPPNTFQFAVDLANHRILTVEGYVIDILTADGGSVSYKIRRNK